MTWQEHLATATDLLNRAERWTERGETGLRYLAYLLRQRAFKHLIEVREKQLLEVSRYYRSLSNKDFDERFADSPN